MAINLDRIEKLPLLQKVLIVAAVIALIYVLFYILWVTKQNKVIKSKQEELSKLQYEVSQGKAVLAKIEEYERKKVELERDLKDAEKRLPREAKIPELLETLSDLARGNNLIFPRFHPGKQAAGCGGICNEISIDVEFMGLYNDIATFFDQVSKLERIVNVRSLEFVPQKKEKKTAEAEAGTAGNILVKAQMITYMFAGGG